MYLDLLARVLMQPIFTLLIAVIVTADFSLGISKKKRCLRTKKEIAS